MGSPWKMFTQAQGQELINGTNSTWTTINGVNGRKFTSKTDSSKYIFLPAGGMWGNTTHEDPVTCYYWSTKLKSYSDAYYLLTSSTNLYISYNNHRYFGDSIRPVR